MRSYSLGFNATFRADTDNLKRFDALFATQLGTGQPKYSLTGCTFALTMPIANGPQFINLILYAMQLLGLG